MPSAQPIEQQPVTHRSRWGFHPCSHATFLKLKALKKAYWEAVRGLARWIRWNRKLPANQVRTEIIRDTQGRPCGRRVLGPIPEPIYCPVFGRVTKLNPSRTVPGQLADYKIDEAVAIARRPTEEPFEKPLPISEAFIDELYDRLVEWERLPKISAE